MTDETILADKIMEDIVSGGRKDLLQKYLINVYTNSANIAGGTPVKDAGESSTDSVAVATTGAEIIGVARDYNSPSDYPASFSLGVAFADDALIDVVRRSGGLFKIQGVYGRSTTTAKALARGTKLWWGADNKLTETTPTTAGLEITRYAGELVNTLASGTADAVVEVYY